MSAHEIAHADNTFDLLRSVSAEALALCLRYRVSGLSLSEESLSSGIWRSISRLRGRTLRPLLVLLTELELVDERVRLDDWVVLDERVRVDD